MANLFRPVYEADGALPIRLEVAEVEHPAGNHYLHHRLIVSDGRPGVVVAASEGSSLLLVRSNRVSAEAQLWELPRGSSDLTDTRDGDANGDAALIRAGLRELLEETGLHGCDAELIGRYVTDSTVFPQPVAVILCTVNTALPPELTDGEVEESRWFTRDELTQLMMSGNVRDAHTLSAFAFLAGRASASNSTSL